MTDVTPNTKIKSLELANSHNDSAVNVVARAAAYNAFLTGAAVPAGGAATSKPTTGATGGTAATKATAGAATNKTPATGGKPEAGKTETQTPKPGAGKPDATKGAAGAPTGAAVAPDTKAPGGKNTYADVVEALRKVKDKSSKEDAIAILVEDGGGAKSVRDLKPAKYDAVVEACNNVLNADGAGEAGAGGVEDPTAQPDRDELGL